MKCPQCGAWTLVLDTRTAKATNVKRRRYECGNLHRFATMEYIEGMIGRSSMSTKRDAVLSTLPRAGELPGLNTRRKQDGEQ